MRWLLFFALCFASSANAQKLYRCGNQYQDRACDSGPGKQISGVANGAAQLPPAFTELSCAKRGEAAEAIAKKLSGGASSEQLLQEIDGKSASADSKLAEKRLVVDVAQLKGSPAEIRVLAESDCAMAKKAQPVSIVQPQRQSSNEDSYRENEIAMQRQRDERAAADKQRKCEEYARDLRNIRSGERAGGSARHMDQLREEGLELETKRRSLGCS
ncbi:MAG TPA: hypothetical protein VJM53_01155 [Burkholderiales bacterium]|nr:hypothetical protein [Burkholderiales bacterium]